MLLINGIDRKYRWSSMLTSVLGKERCLVDGKGGEMMSDEFINRFKIENSWYKTKSFTSPRLTAKKGFPHIKSL